MTDNIEVTIDVEIRQGPSYGSGLSIKEVIQLRPQDFIELCRTLSQFHELAEKIRKEQHAR